jgi:hypothetical protein
MLLIGDQDLVIGHGWIMVDFFERSNQTREAAVFAVEICEMFGADRES